MIDGPGAPAAAGMKAVARLADALGLPAAAFTSDPGSDASRVLLNAYEMHLLALVEVHLNSSVPSDRNSFVEALRDLLGAERP